MNTHLSMSRGDAHRWGFRVVDPEYGRPVNITAAPIRFTAKRDVKDDDDDAIIVKTLGSGITITDGPGGECTVQLAAIDTDALVAPVTLVWDLQVMDSSGPQSVIQGRLSIAADVSRTAP